MSERTGLRLNELVPEELAHLDDIVKHELNQNPQNAGGPRIAKLGWRAVRERAGHAIRSALDFDVRQLFGRAWCEAPEMREFTDESKYPTDREWTVSLGKHPVKITTHPELAVTCANVKVAKAVFNLEIEAEFRSVVLAIRSGRITAIWSADVEIMSVLKYGNSPLHGPLKSGAIEFVDRYEFPPPGLAIL